MREGRVFVEIAVAVVAGLIVLGISWLIRHAWRWHERKAPADSQRYLAILKLKVTREPPDWFVTANKLLKREKFIKAVTLLRSGLKQGLPAQNQMVVHAKIGFAYYRIGDYMASLKEYTKCYGFARNAGNEEVMAHAAKSMGDALHRIGRSEEARQRFDEALGIYRRMNLRRYAIDAEAAIGQLLLNQGDLKSAEKRFKRKLRYHLIRGRDQGVADAKENLGVLYQRKRSYGKAIMNLKRAKRIYKKHKLVGSVLAVKNTLGAVYQEKGNLQDALNEFQEIQQIARKHDSFILEAFALNNMGSVQLGLGEIEEAKLNAETAFGAFDRMDYALGKATSLGLLGAIERIQRNPEKAVEMHQKMLEVAEAANLAREITVARYQLAISKKVLEESRKK